VVVGPSHHCTTLSRTFTIVKIVYRPCHPRRSEAEIALLSSPTERSGDRSFVIPDGAKRRSGTELAPHYLVTPGQPPWAEPGESLRPPGSFGFALNAAARGHALASPPPVSRLSPSGLSGRDQGVWERPVPDLRFASSGMTRRVSGRTPARPWGSGGGCGNRGRGGWSHAQFDGCHALSPLS
jgi:hypothetical protein